MATPAFRLTSGRGPDRIPPTGRLTVDRGSRAGRRRRSTRSAAARPWSPRLRPTTAMVSQVILESLRIVREPSGFHARARVCGNDRQTDCDQCQQDEKESEDHDARLQHSTASFSLGVFRRRHEKQATKAQAPCAARVGGPERPSGSRRPADIRPADGLRGRRGPLRRVSHGRRGGRRRALVQSLRQ